MGRFGETALWVLIALRSGPAGASNLLTAVRALDGPVGPGTLFGALARLEHLSLVERTPNGAGRAVYRLPIHTQGTSA
jgi:hypothetical protein